MLQRSFWKAMRELLWIQILWIDSYFSDQPGHREIKKNVSIKIMNITKTSHNPKIQATEKMFDFGFHKSGKSLVFDNQYAWSKMLPIQYQIWYWMLLDAHNFIFFHNVMSILIWTKCFVPIWPNHFAHPLLVLSHSNTFSCEWRCGEL